MTEKESERDWPAVKSRCPVCQVAPEDDHMSWCEFEGRWTGRPGERRDEDTNHSG